MRSGNPIVLGYSGVPGLVHWMVYAASAAFLVYFALPLVERILG